MFLQFFQQQVIFYHRQLLRFIVLPVEFIDQILKHDFLIRKFNLFEVGHMNKFIVQVNDLILELLDCAIMFKSGLFQLVVFHLEEMLGLSELVV